ncbi:MAG: hypothetical protein OHK0022_00780 [Roseiflexaceae bacterium]
MLVKSVFYRRGVLIALLVALLGGVFGFGLPARPALAAATDTVFLLHGYNDKANSSGQGDAWDCLTTWSNQRTVLRAMGHTGRTQTIGYYSDNKNCDRNLASTIYTKDYLGDPAGPRQGGPANFSVLTYDTSLTHVAYRFAWAAAREYRDYGRPIRVIADSLGGLVVRQAIAKSSLGDPDFPSLSQIQIIGVYAYGSPFYGTPAGSLSGTIQGVQARVGSDFINTLNSTNYTRVGSARWFSFTSNLNFTGGDGFISSDSACWLKSIACYRYTNPAYFHGGYFNDTNTTTKRWGAYQYRLNPSFVPWSNAASIDDIGAAAVVARLIVTNG